MKRTSARIISLIFHPSVIAVLATFLVVLHSAHTVSTALVWAGVMGVIVFTVFLFELYGIKKGFFSNLDVSNRKQRKPLFLFVLLMVVLFMTGIVMFNGPIELLIGGLYIIIGIAVFIIVNKQIKASVHVAALSAFFVSMALIFGGFFYLGLICIPVIAWSRVVLRRHTVSEVIVGASLGISLTVVIYLVIQYFQL